MEVEGGDPKFFRSPPIAYSKLNESVAKFFMVGACFLNSENRMIVRDPSLAW